MSEKPKEAIERMRDWLSRVASHAECPNERAILAYLDSIPDNAHVCVWPKELTRERLEELALDDLAIRDRAAAFHALAAIAPERKKRVVNLWRYAPEDGVYDKPTDWAPREHTLWRKVAGPIVIDA